MHSKGKAELEDVMARMAAWPVDNGFMPPTALADWTSPQPFALPELGPGVEGELRAQLEAALRRIAADPAVKALVLFGSREIGRAHV